MINNAFKTGCKNFDDICVTLFYLDTSLDL